MLKLGERRNALYCNMHLRLSEKLFFVTFCLLFCLLHMINLLSQVYAYMCIYIKHLSEHMWWSLGHKQIRVTPLRSSVSSIKPQKQLISPDRFMFRNSSGYVFMLYVIIKHL